MDRLEFKLANLRKAQRCLAKNRAGRSCQSPAIRGRKRCRLHGGLTPRGRASANFKTGEWTIEAVEERRWARTLVTALTNKDAIP